MVYVAVSEARGHLMRASQVCPMLRESGLRIAPMVFGARGRAFFQRASGMDAVQLSRGYANAYSPDHSQDVAGSTHNILHYTFSADGARDMLAISRRLRGARVLINDLSTSPPAVSMALPLGGPHLVNVVSENNYYALVNIDKLCGHSLAGRVSKRLSDLWFYAAERTFVNTLDTRRWFTRADGLYFLPPFTQRPQDAQPSPCRYDGPGRRAKRLFVAYFNPEYRDPTFVGHLLEAARRADAYLYLVSEHAHLAHADLQSDRVQLVATDFGLASLIQRADLFITAAGLAAPLQAYIAGTPLLVVVNRAHIEHSRNADTITSAGIGHVVERFDDCVAGAEAALDRGQSPHPELPERTRQAWRSELHTLVDRPRANLRGPGTVITALRQPRAYG